jgi:hypothetical protein
MHRASKAIIVGLGVLVIFSTVVPLNLMAVLGGDDGGTMRAKVNRSAVMAAAEQ